MPFPSSSLTLPSQERSPNSSSPRWTLFIVLLVVAFSTGCAGHSAKTLKARAALDAGNPSKARDLLNAELKVKEVDEIPVKEKKATPLLVLDRSLVSQALEDYKASSSDLQYSDKKVEMMDMSRTALDSIGKYVFSDSAGLYKAPPYEKVMINTMNIVNYLAAHDLNGARIEARRMSIMQDYLNDTKHPATALNAPGGYLAGFVFERSGRPDIALRYYDEALQHADFKSLAGPVARLSRRGSYSTPRLKEFLKKHPAPASTETSTASSVSAEPSEETQPAIATAPAEDEDSDGDVLVIVNYGRVPAKEAKRIPIGLALTFATLYLSPSATSTANRLAAQGLVTWINYPELEKDTRRVGTPSLQVNGQTVLLEGAADLNQETRNAYDKEKGKIIASAITRMISRVVAGESAGAAAKAGSDKGWVGALVSLGTQAVLTAADTPDTRSWSTLPARIAVGRLRLPPGVHEVTIKAQGVTKTTKFKLEPKGWEAIVLTVLR